MFQCRCWEEERTAHEFKKKAELTGPLQDERQDGRAERRVVAELLQVAAVLPLGPNGHLDEAHQSEEGHRQTLGHEGETKPGAQLQGEGEGCDIRALPPHYTEISHVHESTK